jgi:hypothetical protein
VSQFRFLCDEHISVSVYRALLEAHFDILHLLLLGLGGMADPDVFRRARVEGRILLTRNYKDFALLVEQQGRTKESFPGALFVSRSLPQADAGAHVRALKKWVKEAQRGVHRIENTYGWLR